VRGFGISKHFSPLLIEESQPRQRHSLPATANLGTPAEPLISDGMLFFDILKLLNFPRQIVQDFTKPNYGDPEFFCGPCCPFSASAEAFIQLFVHHLEGRDEVILRAYPRLQFSRKIDAGW
jgi:hypothetical protein